MGSGQAASLEIQRCQTDKGAGYWHFKAGTGNLTYFMLATLNDALTKIPPELPVVLQSEALTLPTLRPVEERDWLIQAGIFRRTQERFKIRGGLLVSVVTRQLLGGTYLVFGMAAQHRLIIEGAIAYPSLSAEAFEQIFHRPYPHSTEAKAALSSGLVTEIAPAAGLHSRLMQLLDGSA